MNTKEITFHIEGADLWGKLQEKLTAAVAALPKECFPNTSERKLEARLGYGNVEVFPSPGVYAQLGEIPMYSTKMVKGGDDYICFSLGGVDYSLRSRHDVQVPEIHID